MNLVNPLDSVQLKDYRGWCSCNWNSPHWHDQAWMDTFLINLIEWRLIQANHSHVLYLAPSATLNKLISFNRQVVHVQLQADIWVQILYTFMRQTKNTLKVSELLGRDCWEEKSGRRVEGGRWPPPLWAHWDRQAGQEKCSNSFHKWHPERVVSQRTTLIPMLGLCSENPTPTYSVNEKVTFEKWGPHRDLIHWLTPGRGAFPLGGCVI